MLIEIKKKFKNSLLKVKKDFTISQNEIIKTVIKLICNDELTNKQYDCHVIGKWETRDQIIKDCHPLFYDNKNIDLIIVFAIDRRQKRISLLDIGSHKEIFGK